MDEKEQIVALQEILEVDVRSEMHASAACYLSREVSVAQLSPALEIRPVNEGHARPCGQENLTALLRRLFEPSLANQRLETLDDGAELGPVGKDVMRKGFRESTSLGQTYVFGYGKVQSFIEPTAFASAHMWCNILVLVRGHDGRDDSVVVRLWV